MDDLLLLNEQFSDYERMIRDSVVRFVTDEVEPVIATAFEQEIFPQKFIQKIAALGLLGLTLPPEYGGVNGSHRAYGLVCQELERGDSSLRSFVSVQSSLCMYPIYQYGTD